MSLARGCGRRSRVLRLWQLWWAVRVGIWFCGLPVRLRLYSLPGLLQRLTPARGRQQLCSSRELESLVAIVGQLGERRPFRGAVFPRACLRQALALYYVCTRLGHPVTIHFGVAKVGETLEGHSWVTIEGQVVADRTWTDLFQVVYAYPSSASRPPGERRGASGRPSL
jgi:hypothetical protein